MAKESQAESNQGSERLVVTSGMVLAIDQFMLGNKQFIAAVADLRPEKGDMPRWQAEAQNFGGCVLETPPGTYLVHRDAHLQLMVLAGADEQGAHPHLDLGQVLEDMSHLSVQAKVFIDTRCLALVDLSFFSDSTLREQYCRYASTGELKQARDFVRTKGGAVRYGFERHGDELGVYLEKNLIALFAD